MKTMTVRLPETLAAKIEVEARRRRMSKSEVIRERLERPPQEQWEGPATVRTIGAILSSPSHPSLVTLSKKERSRRLRRQRTH
jgi:Arc/MetJ-type ribon-helix-helix transcriptional regulator